MTSYVFMSQRQCELFLVFFLKYFIHPGFTIRLFCYDLAFKIEIILDYY